jgi:integrase
MQRLGYTAVPHGLRSSFRDWAADKRKDADLAEAALAHAIRNKTVAAYQRSDLLQPRRTLMQEWADFATGEGASDESRAAA